MLNDKMQKSLNEQINAEIFSGYLYMSMSAWFRSRGLDGFAAWMHAQALEELEHASKFYDFVYRRGGRVLLTRIDSPKTEWESPEDALGDVLDHERKVTGLINDLVDLSMAEKDHATHIFLQWFVTEQIEEEENAETVLSNLKMLEGSKQGLFMLDREMGQRKAPYVERTEKEKEQ